MSEEPINKMRILLNKEGITGGADRFASLDKDLLLVNPPNRQNIIDEANAGVRAIAPVDIERVSLVKFIAREVETTPDWKMFYYKRMMEFNIKPQEILDELARTNNRRPAGVKLVRQPFAFKPTLAVITPAAAPAEAVIYCWPFHVEAPDGKFTLNSKAASADPIVTVVTIFGAVWIIATLLMVGAKNFGSLWYLFKVIPFIMLPLLGLMKGLTHIRVGRSGVTLQSASGKSALRSNLLSWNDIEKVYLEPAKDGRNVLTGKLIFSTTKGKRKIALKKIASASQWRKLVEALNVHAPHGALDLDPALLDGICQGATRDPSYTKLWLDALTSPPMRERLLPLVPGIELQKGRYKIESLLGAGGQGSAYLASTSDGKVVLKEYILPVYVDVKVRRQALETFEKESRLMALMNYSGIVKTTNSFIEDHRAYLSLEYVSGKSLKQLVEDQGPLSEAECIRFAIEMCEILIYLHSQAPPIVHQDFTPDNLLIAPDGSLKLIDFMVAKQWDGESASGAAVGKHHYMPPEQFRGKATTRSDIYALGCTLNFLLTGCRPEPMSTSHPIIVNREVCEGMNNIVERATMLDQNVRYQSATSLMQDLKLLLPTQL